MVTSTPALAPERAELVAQYQGLRVTDVCDGMDRCGLQDVGLLDWESWTTPLLAVTICPMTIGPEE